MMTANETKNDDHESKYETKQIKNRQRMSSYGPTSLAFSEVSSFSDYNDPNDNPFQRPRRPNPDTLSYCKVLPLSLHTAQMELKELDQSIKSKDINETDLQEQEEIIQTHFPTRIAAQSAIEEVQHEIASLAGDEMGSSMMETLASIVTLELSNGTFHIPPDSTLIQKMLLGLQGYHLHLASHRYGSHVVQTIFQCAGKCLKENLDKTKKTKKEPYDHNHHEDETEATPSLHELIQNAANELMPYSKQLAVHVCGSHVLRTLFYLLAGVELAETARPGGSIGLDGDSFPRGKPKKKKKKKHHGTITGGGGGSAGKNNSFPLLISYSYKHTNIMTAFQNCLMEFTNSFIYRSSNDNTSHTDHNHHDKRKIGYELQTLVCHPSAGPLFSILLRVLCIMTTDNNVTTNETNSNGTAERDFRLLGILPPEPQYQTGSTADDLVKAVLCWEEDQDDNAKSNCGDIIYGLSGEPTGSIFLETILRTCASNDFYSQFCDRASFFKPDALCDYTTHSVSNFVIQTLLNTCRSKEQADLLCKGLMPCIMTSSSPPPNHDDMEKKNDENQFTTMDAYLPLLLQKKRRGVLWRFTELCSKWKVGQETLLKSISIGFAVAYGNDNLNTSSLKEGNQDEKTNNDNGKKSSKSRRKKKMQSLPIDQCIRKLLDFNISDVGSGRISLDSNGARTIYHLLHFVPRLCSDILDAIVKNMSMDEIEMISKDGLGSRCIIDAILSNPSKSMAPFSTTIQTLSEKLKGRWTSLSADRVGHHMVKKIFHALPTLDLKLILVQELSQEGRNRLNGNAMGRAVLEECFVNDFLRGGEYTWRDIVSKKMKQKKWLDELGNGKGNDDDNDDDNDEGAVLKKKKRRKRKRKALDDDINAKKNKEDTKASVVNSIMDAMVMPKKD